MSVAGDTAHMANLGKIILRTATPTQSICVDGPAKIYRITNDGPGPMTVTIGAQHFDIAEGASADVFGATITVGGTIVNDRNMTGSYELIA